MNSIKAIRERLGLTQEDFGKGIGCTQGNVGHYERGQTVPPDAAKRIIEYAQAKGVVVTYEDIYGSVWNGKTDRRKAKV
jgi:putative transcriptional regulator